MSIAVTATIGAIDQSLPVPVVDVSVDRPIDVAISAIVEMFQINPEALDAITPAFEAADSEFAGGDDVVVDLGPAHAMTVELSRLASSVLIPTLPSTDRY